MSESDSVRRASSASKSEMGTSKTRTIRFMLTLFGLLCFFGLLYFGGFESFGKITEPDYPWLFTAFTGTGMMVYVFAIRWGGIVNSLVGRRVINNINYFFYSLSSLLAGTFIPHTATTTIGKAAALMKFQKVSLQHSGTSVLLDKLFDGFFMLMFFWPILLLITDKVTVRQTALICLLEFVVVTILIVINYSLWLRLLQGIVSGAVRLLVWLPFLKKNKQLNSFSALHKIKELDVLQRHVVLRAYFLTALGQLLLAIRSWLAAMAVGLNMITPLETFIAIGLVQASILISFTPGALGFADAAWFIALESAGVPKEIIAVFLVAHRIIENLAILLCWLPLYLLKIWGNFRKYTARNPDKTAS